MRVGIVGAGANTVRRHIPGFLAIADVEIVAVSNRTRASSERVAREHDIETIHDDWHALTADDSVDAVLIGTWPNMHHPVTTAALTSGKHVLCEARMAMNSQEAHEMLEAAVARPDLVAQVVPSPLSFRVDATIRRLIDEGYLGSPVAVDVEDRTGEFPDPDAPLHWREDARLSGNNIMTLGIWYETLMRWIGEAINVSAVGSVTIPVRPDGIGSRAVSIPDHLEVIAEMAWGARARMQMSSVTGLRSANGATLFGSEGVLRFDGDRLYGGRKGDDSLRPVHIPDREAGSWQAEADFIRAIRGQGAVTLTDFETGVKYMEFTDAVWLSMQQRRAIALPLVERSDG